ncbi:hypothetical protein C8J56DRAFT_769355, partial [Mycena floridula]
MQQVLPGDRGPTTFNYLIPRLTALVSTDWLLHLYQLTMAIGMLMIVVGYVGCFNLVNQSTAANGPYVWLSLEVILSILRITLWGWDSLKSDATMIQMGITLTEDMPLSATSTPFFPTLCPTNYNARQTNDQNSIESFLVQEESQFLGSITGFAGPFSPFKAEAVGIYYALVGQADPEHKFLVTIIRNLRNESLTALVHPVDVLHNPITNNLPLSATWNQLPGMTDAMQVTLGENLPFVYNSDSNILLSQIGNHSRELAQRLAGCRRIWRLDLSWKKLTVTKDDKRFYSTDYPPLSQDDKAYMSI